MSRKTHTWRVELSDGSAHTVRADNFHEDGTYTVFWKTGEGPVFAVPTAAVLLISRCPDDGDAAETGPAPDDDEPDASQPLAATINVQGSVMAERDLCDVIDRQMRALGLRGNPDGQPYARR